MATNLIPNSFQCPNFLIDRLDYYLTPAETKVLIKAVREILGWNDKIPLRKSAIGLSIFVKGKPTKDVKGCGLGLGAVREALEHLDKFRILVKKGPPTREGQMYWLQDDTTQIDWKGLEDRRAEWDQANLKRTQKATQKRLESNGVTSDVRGNVGRDTPMTSDVTEGVTSDVNKETHETQTETQNKTDSLPTAIDAHQRAIDRANGGKAIDPIMEVAKHICWLCLGQGVPLPRSKSGNADYIKAARLLLEQTDKADWREVCHAIDDWSESPPKEDQWRRDRTKEPLFSIKHLASHYWSLRDKPELSFPQSNLDWMPEAREVELSDEEQLWENALGELKLEMTRATFDRWLRQSQAVGRENGMLIVGVRDEYAMEWLTHRLKETVERTLQGLGVSSGVDFRVLP